MELVGIWGLLATPGNAVFCAIAMVAILTFRGFHKAEDGSLARRRLASVVALSASAYTFGICILSQLCFDGPSVGEVISNGFGDERVAWLLMVFVADSIFRIWDEFRPSHI